MYVIYAYCFSGFREQVVVNDTCSERLSESNIYKEFAVCSRTVTCALVVQWLVYGLAKAVTRVQIPAGAVTDGSERKVRLLAGASLAGPDDDVSDHEPVA